MSYFRDTQPLNDTLINNTIINDSLKNHTLKQKFIKKYIFPKQKLSCTSSLQPISGGELSKTIHLSIKNLLGLQSYDITRGPFLRGNR